MITQVTFAFLASAPPGVMPSHSHAADGVSEKLSCTQSSEPPQLSVCFARTAVLPSLPQLSIATEIEPSAGDLTNR